MHEWQSIYVCAHPLDACIVRQPERGYRCLIQPRIAADRAQWAGSGWRETLARMGLEPSPKPADPAGQGQRYQTQDDRSDSWTEIEVGGTRRPATALQGDAPGLLALSTAWFKLETNFALESALPCVYSLDVDFVPKDFVQPDRRCVSPRACMCEEMWRVPVPSKPATRMKGRILSG